MKYFKLLLLLLISNLLISQSSQRAVSPNQQTLIIPSVYEVESDNLKPPICFAAIILDGATIVKGSNKKTNASYYIHNAKKFIVNGPPGEIVKDFKHVAFKTSDGKIDFYPLQKVGKILTESTNSDQQFKTSSKQYIGDISALPTDSKREFLEAIAANPSLAKAWVTLDNIGFPIAERTNLSNLKTVSAYFAKYPSRTSADVETTAKLFSNIDDYLNILPSIVDNNPVNGTKYDDFENVSGFKGDFHNAEYSFFLWSKEKWSTLESFFKTNSINGEWPPNNGGYNEIHNVLLRLGMTFDRYGNAITIDSITGPLLGGTFTSPFINGKPYSFGQRALNKPENTYDFYYVIEVKKELPFTSLDAVVIPWFGQEGNGKQAMWNITKDPDTGYPLTWNKLAEFGYIKVTIKSSPSGKYPQFVNFVIQ